MYVKYLIFSCITAFVIIISKFLYQKWVQHVVETKNTSVQVFSLEKRVEALEKEMKEQQASIAGGVQIPITFKPLQPSANKKRAVFADEEEVVDISNEVQSTQEHVAEEIQKETIDTASYPYERDPIQAVMDADFEQKPVVNDEPISMSFIEPVGHSLEDDVSVHSNSPVSDEASKGTTEVKAKRAYKKRTKDISHDVSQDASMISEKKADESKKKSKKQPTANAKNYANGDKIQEEGVEYICVVGKNGGHSWKRIDMATSTSLTIDTTIIEPSMNTEFVPIQNVEGVVF